jgi:hypothetical protein
LIKLQKAPRCRVQLGDPPPGGLLVGLHPQRSPQCGERGHELGFHVVVMPALARNA